MGYRWYPSDGSREIKSPVGRAFRGTAGATAPMYVDETLETLATGLLDADGEELDAETGLVLDQYSQLPDFQVPDTLPEPLWTSVLDGPAWPVWSRPAERLASLEERVTDLEESGGGGGGGGVPTSRQIIAGTGLTGGGDLTADRTLTVSYGTSSGTAAQGNDSRLSNARTPTAHATSHGTGQSDEVTPAAIGAVPTSRQVIAGTGLTGGGTLAADRTLTVAYGTSSTTAARGDDSRLSDARTPTAHAASHATGQSDAISPANIGAATSGHNHSGTYQPLDADLTTIAGLTVTTSGVLQESGGAWAVRTPTQLAATLPSDQSAATASLRTLGTGATQAAPGSTSVQTSRQVIAGTGAGGGGALSADVTLSVLSMDLDLGETVFTRYTKTDDQQLNNGAVHLSYFRAKKTETITRAYTYVGGGPANTATLGRVGIYSVAGNGDLTLIASTPAGTVLWTGGFTVYDTAFSASWTKTQGQIYAWGLISLASDTPSLACVMTGVEPLAARAPRINGVVSGQTDLPSSISAGSVSTDYRIFQGTMLPAAA